MKKRLLLGLFAVPVFSIIALAAGFTVEQVLSSPFPTGLTSAKRSARIAWVFNAKGERNVWVADGPEWKARRVTHFAGDDGQPIASLRLTPDGKTIVFARGSETNGQGLSADPASTAKDVKQQVFAMDVDASAEPRLLGEMGCPFEDCEDIEISPDGKWAVWAAKKSLWLAPLAGDKPARQIIHLRGAAGEQKWSPDGKSLAFMLDRGDHSFIVVFNVEKESIVYIAPTADRDSLPRWSPDGKKLAWIRQPGREVKLPLIPERPRPWAIWVAEASGANAKEVFASGSGMDDSIPHFIEGTFHYASGGHIVFSSERDGWSRLYSVADAGGEATGISQPGFDVEESVLSPDGAMVVYTSNVFAMDPDDQDRRHMFRVKVTGGAIESLTSGKTIEWSPVSSGDGKDWFCIGSTATSPAMPYHLNLNKREMLAADALPKEFPSDQLVAPQRVLFKSEDGLTIHGQLFVPKGRAKPGPALIFTHGGPPRHMMLGFHYMDYYHNAYAANQYLASKGYVVLSVNYRLGIMYGRHFREPANAVWRGSSEYKDVVAGARYLQSLEIVDKKRIGLWGGSYGGLLTALGLARNSDIFSAGVDFHGVHDWSMFLGEWEENPAQSPDYKDAMKLAFESSPNASVDKWKSPVLLIHGDDDRNVPFPQTSDLVQRLRAQHVEFEQIIFPDEVHGFLRYASWVRAYTAMGDFFDRKLK